MKKSLISILLILATLLCACQTESEVSSTPSNQESSAPPEYLSIEQREAEEFKTENFAHENSNYVYSFTFPEDWEIKSGNNGEYTIKRDKKEIGAIYNKLPKNTKNKVLGTKTEEKNGIKITESVEKLEANGKSKYICRYVYDLNEDKLFSLEVDYSEAGKSVSSKLKTLKTNDITKHTGFNTLSDLKDGRLLFLGNSFIASSEIAYILQEMFSNNGKSCTAEGISRGYATVSTYANDYWKLLEIEGGHYDAIFLCGFYSISEVPATDKIKAACEKSNTQLIFFPAHNEISSIVDMAAKRHSYAKTMNWKGEIDNLIGTGISKWEFCFDDQHLHSTSIAGYVGAHMVYRAIYGEVPKVAMSNTYYQPNIDSVLGDYVKNGYSEKYIGIENIHRF